MKKTLKQATLTVLFAVLFAICLVLTPGMSMTAQAADVSFVANSNMKLVDDGNLDLSHVMFWKGQEVSFSVELGLSSAVPQWKVYCDGIETTDILASGNPTTKIGTASKTVTQKFVISDNAVGEYTIVAVGTTENKDYDLKVQEKMVSSFFHGYSGDETYMTNLWTGTTVYAYVVSAKGEPITHDVTGSDLVTMSPKTNLSTNIPYFGEGSEVHEYEIKIGDTIADGKNQNDSAVLTAACGIDTQEIEMYFKQSASSFHIESVTCEDCDGGHNVSHFDVESNSLRFDLGQKVAIRVVCEGSYVEEPSMTTDDNTYFKSVEKPLLDENAKADIADVVRDKEANTTSFTAYFEVRQSTKDYEKRYGKALYTHINMGSGKTERVGVRIYNATFIKNPNEYYIYNNSNSANKIDSLNLYEGQTGQLHDSITISDPQEKVKYVWVSGSKNCFTIDSNTGVYRANSEGGSAVYQAVIQDTKSGTRGQTRTINVTVTPYRKPAKISLKEGPDKESAVTANSTKTLYVGDPESTITYWVNEEGGEPPYNMSYGWQLTAVGIVSCDAKEDGKWAVITPKKKGNVILKTRANEDSNLYAPSISYNVYAPIKTITLKADNEEVVDNSIFKVQGRKVTMQAVRDAEASSEEKLVWSSSDPSTVALLDAQGQEVDSFVGNTCVIKMKKAGTARVNVEAEGFGSHSTASSFVSVDVQDRIPAENIVFINENGDEITEYTAENPYEITLVKENNKMKDYVISFTGYDNNGNYTNDLFAVTSEEEGIAKVVTSSVNAPVWKMTVSPVKAGLVLMPVVNEITGDTIEFWVRIRNELSMVEATIDPISSEIYDGKVKTPEVVVRDANGNVLTKGTDYNLYWSPASLVNVGCYVVTVRGMGKYTDECTATFNILPEDISETTVTVNNGIDLVYNGNYQTPAVTVKFNETMVVPNTNYTLTYSSNKNAGKAKVTLTGKGNFKGTKVTYFTIKPKSVAAVSAQLEYTSVAYSGNYNKPKVTVKDMARNKVLKLGTDYSVSYKNNKNAGTATVTVKGLGNYGESKTMNFTITKKMLTAENIALSKVDYFYTGKTCKPAVTVKDGSTVLKKNRDYSITYPADMKNKGVKTISISGLGNYSGNANATYYIITKISVKTPAVKKISNNTTRTITANLGKVEGAAGYEATYSTSSTFTQSTTKTKESTGNTIKLTKLTKGKYYYVKCRAYKIGDYGRKVYSGYTTVKKIRVNK